jgi:uncharacterized protein YdaU (DUF1376 family)
VIWFKFHIGDYITHTRHLSDAHDLCYRRLIDLYYMSEAPICVDQVKVSRKIGIDLDITESVLDEFFMLTEKGYVNNRCDNEIARYQAQCQNNKKQGLKGGRPRKDSREETESEPKDNPKKIQIQIKKSQKHTSAAPTLRFADFWQAWPASKRKVAKNAVEARWSKMALDPLADEIIASVTRLRASEAWLSGFDPAPMTFINQRRWEDDKFDAPARRVI